MIKNKTLKRCTVAILIAVLLTFTVNKTVSVSAFAITGSVVAASLLATGAVYLGYIALTGAEIQLPRENVRDYVSNIGNKIAQYGTGAGIYTTIYNKIFNHGIENYEDIDIDLDEKTLLGLYNTNKDIAQIQHSLSFTQSNISDNDITTNFEYPFIIDITPSNVRTTGNQYISLQELTSTVTFTNWNNKVPAISHVGTHYVNWYITTNTHYNYMRNVLYINNSYGIQVSQDNKTWNDLTYAYRAFQGNGAVLNLATRDGNVDLSYNAYNSVSSQYMQETYPILTNAPIYIQSTGEIIETVQGENGVYVNNPQWPNNHEHDNNDNKYPLVPYVQLPTSDPSTYVPSKWGINVGTLLDKLDELADSMITAGTIGEIINAFKDSLGGTDVYNNYVYYENDGIDYYYYYNNTFQDNDTYNNNTDIQGNEYLMPVDLNTLSTVTNNEYINTIKNTAADISQTVGDYVAFWHNVDYQIVYILLGGALFLLVCALIGKMGK